MADASDSVSGSEDEFNSPESPGPSTLRQSNKSTRKDSGAAKYRSKFSTAWKKQYPFINEVRTDKHSFYCTICKHNVKYGHMGLSDVQQHLTTSMHQRYAKTEIAKNYSSRRTKTACIINGTVAPFFQQSLVEHAKNNPFSIAIDGSSDNALEKINPLTVRIFYVNRGNVYTQFLDMCMSSSSTAEGIFSKMEDAFTTHDVSWNNCVGLGVDNTSVNMGCRNSIKTRVLEKNPAIYIMGCPCHTIRH
ncbi:methyltransferase 15 [Paramuricea clavata]|uniref:Methyltransferase 15 n=1 Tax=Paramuricea clavata TaxID=317549 RepID=A0A6S7JGI7_PARCT|nr:methyltransferase 15 [Paramuricea clavata]